MHARSHHRLEILWTASVAAALLAAAASVPHPAAAEPYMALREGYACGDCHTNRTGGGMRNLTVAQHGADIMNVVNDGAGVLPEVDERFSPRINDFLSVGADFRIIDRLLFQDDPGADKKVKNNTAFRDLESNDLDIEQATVYAELRLIPERLSLYIDERIAPGGADNREIFGLLTGVLPFDAYIKVGQFFAPWGIKLQDDEAFVASRSGFNFDNNVTGIEVGRSGEGFNWFVSVAESTEDQDLEQLVTASGYYMWTDSGPFESVMLGASAAYDAPDDNEVGTYTAFGGLSLGPLVLLAQGVLRDTETETSPGSFDDNQAWVVYGEADYLIAGWLNAKLAFDWFDPDDDLSGDVRNRISVGIEPFIDEYLQLRLFYRVFNGPENEVDENRDELTLEAHLFF